MWPFRVVIPALNAHDHGAVGARDPGDLYINANHACRTERPSATGFSETDTCPIGPNLNGRLPGRVAVQVRSNRGISVHPGRMWVFGPARVVGMGWGPRVR